MCSSNDWSHSVTLLERLAHGLLVRAQVPPRLENTSCFLAQSRHPPAAAKAVLWACAKAAAGGEQGTDETCTHPARPATSGPTSSFLSRTSQACAPSWPRP